VGSVPDFEVGELPAAGVGEERGEPVSADVGEPQLRAGVRPFPADDQPGPLWPGVEVTQPVISATCAPSRGCPSMS